MQAPAIHFAAFERPGLGGGRDAGATHPFTVSRAERAAIRRTALTVTSRGVADGKRG